jgi:hypothetical protein
VEDSVDLDRGDGRAFDRGEQAATQGIANRRGESPLKGLRRELAVGAGQRLGVDVDALGALETLPKHSVAP